MVSLTVDGLIYASSMMMLDSARRATPVPALARWLIGWGVAARLAANVADGLGHGLAGAAVAAWPAVALVGLYEVLMIVIHSSQVPAGGTPRTERVVDPLQARAAELFAGQLVAEQVPSAILKVPAQPWTPAYDGGGQVRDGAWVADITGLRNLPLKGFAENQLRCEIVSLACELLAWTQLLAGRLARSGRRLRLRLAERWPAFGEQGASGGRDRRPSL